MCLLAISVWTTHTYIHQYLTQLTSFQNQHHFQALSDPCSFLILATADFAKAFFYILCYIYCLTLIPNALSLNQTSPPTLTGGFPASTICHSTLDCHWNTERSTAFPYVKTNIICYLRIVTVLWKKTEGLGIVAPTSLLLSFSTFSTASFNLPPPFYKCCHGL